MTSPADYLAAAATAALAAYAAATGTDPGEYLRETPEQATIDTSLLDAAPFIVCGDYTVSGVTNEVGKQFDAAAVTMYFADMRPGQGDSPEAHFAATARMASLFQLFLRALSDLGRPVSTHRRTEIEGLYAAELDGVGVQFTLTVPAAVLC